MKNGKIFILLLCLGWFISALPHPVTSARADQANAPAPGGFSGTLGGVAPASPSTAFQRAMTMLPTPDRIKWAATKKAAEQGNAKAQTDLGEGYLNGPTAMFDPVEGVKWLRMAADQGYIEAEVTLGSVYENGSSGVIAQDGAEALKQFRRATDQGDPDAPGRIGEMYEHGWGVERDNVQAYMWYRIANWPRNLAEISEKLTPAQIADATRRASVWKPGAPMQAAPQAVSGASAPQENPQLLCKDAHCNFLPGSGISRALADGIAAYREPGHHDKALELLLAVKDNPVAQFYIARIYEFDGVHGAEAVKLLQSSADQGFAASQAELGYVYNAGNIVQTDKAKALAYFCKAALQGHVQAAHMAGLFYENGTGANRNDAEALKWYLLAAQRGDAASQYAAAALYMSVTPPNYGEALFWNSVIQYFARTGLQMAPGDPAKHLSYDDANAVRVRARAWTLAQSAEDGKAAYDSGDDERAQQLWEPLAERGDTEAQFGMGEMYETGAGVNKDAQTAMKWFRKAADQGHAQARLHIGNIYYKGTGVAADPVEAFFWLALAAHSGAKDAVKPRNDAATALWPQQIEALKKRLADAGMAPTEIAEAIRGTTTPAPATVAENDKALAPMALTTVGAVTGRLGATSATATGPAGLPADPLAGGAGTADAVTGTQALPGCPADWSLSLKIVRPGSDGRYRIAPEVDEADRLLLEPQYASQLPPSFRGIMFSSSGLTLKRGWGYLNMDGVHIANVPNLDVKNHEEDVINVLATGLGLMNDRALTISGDPEIDYVYLDSCLQWQPPTTITRNGQQFVHYVAHDILEGKASVDVSAGVEVHMLPAERIAVWYHVAAAVAKAQSFDVIHAAAPAAVVAAGEAEQAKQEAAKQLGKEAANESTRQQARRDSAWLWTRDEAGPVFHVPEDTLDSTIHLHTRDRGPETSFIIAVLGVSALFIFFALIIFMPENKILAIDALRRPLSVFEGFNTPYFRIIYILAVLALLPGVIFYVMILTVIVLWMPALALGYSPMIFLCSTSVRIAFNLLQRRIASIPLNGAISACLVLAVLTAISVAANQKNYQTIEAVQAGDKKVASPVTLPDTMALFTYEWNGFRELRAKDVTCEELCQRLLYNGAVKRVMVGDIPPVDSKDMDSPVKFFYIARQESCPKAPVREFGSFWEGDPASKARFDVRNPTPVKLRIAAGECLLSGTAPLREAGMILADWDVKRRPDAVPGESIFDRDTVSARRIELLRNDAGKFSVIERRTQVEAVVLVTPLIIGISGEFSPVSSYPRVLTKPVRQELYDDSIWLTTNTTSEYRRLFGDAVRLPDAPPGATGALHP